MKKKANHQNIKQREEKQSIEAQNINDKKRCEKKREESELDYPPHSSRKDPKTKKEKPPKG